MRPRVRRLATVHDRQKPNSQKRLRRRRLGFEALEDRRLLDGGSGRVLFVDGHAAGLNNGLSWQNAFPRLQDALAIAASGDEVRVGQCTYTPAGPGGNRAATFQLVAGVAVKGGYAGLAGADPDARDIAAFPTVLSGDLNRDDGPNFANNSDNSYHVVTGSGANAATMLDGFTVVGGNANGGSIGSATTAGGGIYCFSGSPTIAHCTFLGNYASWEGGGIFNQRNSSPTFINCSILGNQANGGGGMFNRDGSSATLVNCLVANNLAPAYGGGGIEQLGSSVTLLNSTFYGNSCLYAGSAIYSVDSRSTVTATNCVFWGNPTTSQPGGPPVTSQATITYSCVQDANPNDAAVQPGAGNIDDDPRFVEPLGVDNVNGTGDENVRLRPDSPCIDAGNNAAVPAGLTTDLDGDPRFIGAGVDMGAYEGPHQALVVSTRAVTIDEGSAVAITVALSMPPAGPVNVTVARRSGDTDVGVASGGLLMFNASNFAVPQTVTLVAGPDLDRFNGTALIEASTPGLTSAGITVTERDSDAPPVVYVDQAATGAGTGESWANAYTDLQQALAFAAVQPQVQAIRVAQGTYRPAAPGGSRQASFQLLNNVAVYGGFPSGGGTWDQSNPTAYPTILSGDLDSDDLPVATAADLLEASDRGDNSFHVVRAHGCDETALLDGVTITGGYALGSYPDSCGGGIYGGRLTLRNSTVTGNAALSSGGGIQADGTLTGCTINNNASGQSAGGFSVSQGTLADCTITGNWASSSGGGGSVFSGTLTRCSIGGNTAQDGAGVSIDSGSPTFNDCTFGYNTAFGPGGDSYGGHGGAVYGWEADPEFNHCVFLGNTATSGGAVSQGDGNSVFTACQFLGNTATGGGAIDNFGYNMPIFVNSTFSGNSAQDSGGAVLNRQGSVPVLTNCTFSANWAGQHGGGVASVENYSNQMPDNIKAANCIFWGNRDSGGSGEAAQVYEDAGASAVDHSCVQGLTGALGGTGNIGADPRFVDADGTDDQAGTADDDLRLRGGSPCIDAADNTALPTTAIADLGNCPRFVDDPNTPDTGNGTPPIADMGAYEYQGPRTLYVNDNAPSDPGPGDPLASDPLEDGTAAHPFDAIQEAIAAADHGDTVLVLDGTYVGHGNHDIDFLSKAITVRSQNGAAGTVIDCGADPDEDHRGFYFHSREAQDSVLEGFTITGGRADSGGGMALDGASPTVRQCVLRDNQAVNDGGGIYASGGAPLIVGCTIEANRSDDGAGVACVNGSRMTLDDSTIQHNVAADDGGGVYGSYSDVIVTGCTILGNQAIEGGGLRFRGGRPTIINCTINENSAPEEGGGGIFLRNSNAQIAACTFSGNWTDNDYSPGGGAIYCYGSSPTIEDCSFVRNSTSGGLGAGVYCEQQSSPVIRDSSFVGNYDIVIASAPGPGQSNNFSVVGCSFVDNFNIAIDCHGGAPTVEHCTITGTRSSAVQCQYQAVVTIANSLIAGNRGGIYSGQSAVTVLDSTIADNRGYGGISCQQGPLTMHNSIVWGNMRLASPAPLNENVKLDQGATALLTYCDVGGGWAGECNMDADPGFVSRGHWDDAGTPGYPFDDVWIDGDYRLAAGSPCIDAGSNAAVPPTLTTDLDGNQRIARGAVDMGAYEFQATVTPGVVYVDARATGANSGDSWADAFTDLQDALAAADGCEVWVAHGTYRSAGPGGSRGASFQLAEDVVVKGGYAGLGAPNPDFRDPLQFETILSGDLNGDDQPGFVSRDDNSYHVIVGGMDPMWDSNGSTLDGLTISGGYADGEWGYPESFGGGLYAFNGTVSHCTIRDNAGTDGGGVGRSSGQFVDCLIADNLAFRRGGGVSLDGDHPTFTSCTFSNNVAQPDGPDGRGGGLFTLDNSPTLLNCVFTGNLALSGGGMYAMENYGSEIVNCVFAGNRAASFAGGGLFNDGPGIAGSPVLTNSIFWANTAGHDADELAQIAGETLTINYTCVQGWTGWRGGTGNIGSAPQFVDADGPDDLFGTADDNLRLLPQSPCVNAGDNAAVPATLATDLDGNPRIFEGRVDMGAYELQQSAPPSVFYVDARATGANSGDSWVDAFINLQDALARAAREPYVHEIRVATGTYRPADPGGNRGASFQLAVGVSLQGGYAGLGAPDPDARDVALYPTILSGDLNGDDGPDLENNAENSYHVVIGTGSMASATIDGFTITAGNANGTLRDSMGGGMYVNSSVTVAHCTIADNWAASGAGMYCGPTPQSVTSPTLTEVVFRGNWAIEDGGALWIGDSDVVMTDCTITQNYANHDGGGLMFGNDNFSTLVRCHVTDNTAGNNGGGMCTRFSFDWTMTDCTLAGNTAEHYGGGVYADYDSHLALTRCAITGNTATLAGGGAYLAAEVALVDCTVRANTVPGEGCGGGIYCAPCGTPVISGCTLMENSAESGAAIFLEGIGGGIPGVPQPTITGCTVLWNDSMGGTAVHSSAASPSISNCTIVGNDADPPLYFRGEGRPTVTSSIVWNNVGRSVVVSAPSTATIAYCDIQGGFAGVGNIDVDPRFAGYGPSDTIDVTPAWMSPTKGTRQDPYPDLAWILGEGGTRGYSLRLAEDSPCVGNGAGGANMGADHGVGGPAGAANVTLRLAPGYYDFTDCSLFYHASLVGTGAGAADTTLLGTVAGLRDGARLQAVTVTGADGPAVLLDLPEAPTIDDCTVSGNTNAGGDYWGAITAFSMSKAAIRTCTVSDNAALGIVAYGSGTSIVGCTVSGNAGRGISTHGASIVDCVVTDNRNSGIFAGPGANGAIRGCTVAGNADPNCGGGIVVWHASPTISNCVVEDNQSPHGGGIYVGWDAHPTIVNSLVSVQKRV